jgi:type IV fimbrial biogenesis protein FimT
MMHRIKGVTLVELLTALAIVAILVTLATPSFNNLVLNNRNTTQVNEFVLAMSYAKSEAVKRGVPVSVCARATDTACSGNKNWENGWLVFIDSPPPRGDGTINNGDIVLQIRPPLEGTNTLRAASHSSITFQSNGFVISGSNETFNLCDLRGATYGSRIMLSPQGWLNSQKGAGSCP